MSDYTQITLFTPKDALATGNPLKKIKGADIDPEFSAIAAAIQTKYDSADLASSAEAAALTGDNKLITPGKLAYALQNGSITLGASVLLNGGIAASDVARKGTANVFTASQTISGGSSEKIRLIAADAVGDVYIAFFESDGTTRKGFFGFGNASDDTLILSLEESGAHLDLRTTGGGEVRANNSKIWTAANDGSGSGLDADTLDGLSPNVSNIASTIVARDASRDIVVDHVLLDSAANENPTIGQFVVNSAANGYTRKASLAHVKSQLGVISHEYCHVEASGAISAGAARNGIASVTHGTTGVYTVSYTGTYSTSPIVQVTVSGATASSTRRCIANGSTTAATVTCYDSSTASTLADADFNFLITGN